MTVTDSELRGFRASQRVATAATAAVFSDTLSVGSEVALDQRPMGHSMSQI